jgi:TonB family protein
MRISRPSLVIGLLVPLATFAQSDQTVPPTAASAAAPIEVFEAPRPLKTGAAFYPLEDRRKGREGWVNLSMMIDPTGKPFEIAIADSTGNKSLEEETLKVAKTWRFQPATLNGVPIEAAHEMKVTFNIVGQIGASKDFIANWKLYNKAIADRDSAAAEDLLAKFVVVNLYEDAYFALGRYFYAALWGTQSEQLAWLKRAVAKERRGRFLNDESFLTAMKTLFQLQALEQDFAGAMGSWEIIQSLTKDEASIASLRKAVAVMEEVRTSDKVYTVQGKIGETAWRFGLFKKKFHIEVAEGSIEQLKLRCKKKYVYFDFKPELVYRIADSAGTCSLEVIGNPNTKFQLVQS